MVLDLREKVLSKKGFTVLGVEEDSSQRKNVKWFVTNNVSDSVSDKSPFQISYLLTCLSRFHLPTVV